MRDLSAVAEFYAKHGGPTTTEDRLKHRYANFTRFVNFKSKKILDIGCGSGLPSLTLSQLFHPAFVVGIDSYEGIGEKKENWRLFNSAIHNLHVKNVKNLKMNAFDVDQLLPMKFDVIILDAVLHHIFCIDKAKGLKSLKREIYTLFYKIEMVLEENGYIIIRENCARNIPIEFLGLFQKINIDFRTKHHWKEWTSVIEKAGFRLMDRTIYYPYHLRFLDNKFRKAYWLLYLVPGTVDLIFTKVK